MDQSKLVKVKLSSKIGKKAPVFVTEFSNGRIVSNSSIKFECYKSDEGGSMIESGCSTRKLMAANGRLTYTGDSNDRSAMRYFVGIRNKSTGKMKVYDSTHFRLKPIIESKNDVDDNPNTEKNYWEDRNKLTEAFGDKAQQRILKSRLKLDLKNDSLDELLNDFSLADSPVHPDPFANSPSCASYLPPANKDAPSLDNVFDINDIISPEIDASLTDHAKSWLESYNTNAEAAKRDFSGFVLKYIDHSLDDLDKLKYLLYYNYLVIFQHLSYKDFRRRDPTNSIPEPFKRNMLDKFTLKSATSRSFPLQQKDRLVSHLIVLALLINNYCVCTSHIISDLHQVFPKKIISIAHALGCYVTSRKVGEQNEKFIELKLPLFVVMPKFKKRQF